MWTEVFCLFTFLHFALTQDCAKNPRLPACRLATSGTRKSCDPYYIIPGQGSQCGRQLGGRYMSIDSSTVSVIGDDGDSVIKLPGCFTVQFNVEVFDNAKLDQSFFAKVHFDWLSLREFSDLPCKDQSANGCNGYGNNCYYCDICNSLQKIRDTGSSSSKIGGQFSDVNCPNRPGIYMLKKRICFDDFKELDKNNNCELDALETAEGRQYKTALSNLQQSGFGSVVASFTLAINASSDQNTILENKNREIEQSSVQELESKRLSANWAVNDGQYQEFKRWFVQNRRDSYYKSEFLPMLLSNNEAACLSVSFTVCDKKPTSVGGKITCPT